MLRTQVSKRSDVAIERPQYFRELAVSKQIDAVG
jgi:hypothetical protein